MKTENRTVHIVFDDCPRYVAETKIVAIFSSYSAAVVYVENKQRISIYRYQYYKIISRLVRE